jgi:hypothetical protein
MNMKYRTTAASVIAAVFLLATPLAAGSGGGSSTTEESSSNDMTYITIGLAVLVGGYLIYDAITDSGDDTAAADTGSVEIIDTGVDWDHAIQNEGNGAVTVAVSLMPGPEGGQRAMQLIRAIRGMVGESVLIYEDPIDLGSGPEVQRAALAREFFGVDYLIFQVARTDSLVRFGVASADSVLWTSTDQSGNTMLIVGTEIVQAHIF